MLLVLAVPPSRCPGAPRTWTGNIDNDWYDGDNWTPTGGPDSSNTLYVNDGSPETTSDVTTDNGGSITVNGSSASASASFGALYVGYWGSGTLEVSNGGSLSSNWGAIAYYSGSAGAVTVTGAGSTWTNSGSLIVGDEDTGTLDILDGGSVSNADAYLGRYSATGNGTVTVSDLGSTWTNNGSLYIGGNISIAVGTGAVTVKNDGELEVGGTLRLWNTGTLSILGGSVTCGSFDNSDVGTFDFTGGTMTVDGGAFDPGTIDLWLDGMGNPTLTLNNDATMNLTDDLYLGTIDSGSLNIESGSSVTSDFLCVGYVGSGTLEVSNGGSLSSNWGAIAYYSGSTGAVTVTGVGSTWTNSGSLIVGDKDTGTLDILDGGSVSNADAYLGRSRSATGDGTVIVDGLGSTWTNSGSLYIGGNNFNAVGMGAVTVQNDGELEVGGTLKLWNTGTLSILGGSVTCGSFDNSDVGTFAFTGGTLTVDGGAFDPDTSCFLLNGTGNPTLTLINGATMNLSSYLVVGGTDKGSLNIESGSSVTSDLLFVGYVGSGTLEVSNGGSLSSNGCTIAYISGSAGAVTVIGADSTWTNSNDLTVGGFGSGTLNITGGGAVTVGVNTWVARESGSSGTIHFDNGTLTTGGLGCAFDDLTGTGTINTHGLVSDVDLVFDATHGLNQTFSINDNPGQNITLNLNVDGSGSMGAGYSGVGTMSISDGRVIESTIGYIGYKSSSTGEVTVDGADSTWTNSEDLYIGKNGSGTLNITDGGVVSNSTGVIGYLSGSTGEVTVDGAGSTWTNTGSLCVGFCGSGTLNITGGGAVSNTYGYIGYDSGSTDVVTVDGDGSTWTNRDSLYIGGDGTTNSGGAGTVVVGVGGEVLVGTGGSGDVIAYNDTCSISMNGGKMTIAGGFTTTGGGSGTRAALNYQFDNAGTFGQIICTTDGQTADIQDTTITYSFLGGGNTFVPTVAGCMDFIVAETITGFLTNAADAAYDNMDELLAAANGGTGYPSYAYGIVTIDSDDYVGGAYDGYKALRLSVLPADADLGGLCDGSDLLTWQNGYSNGDTTWDKGDYNLSNLVDGPDLLIWQNNYGKTLGDCSGMGATGAAAAVPEPATLALLAVGACLSLLRRSKSH